MKTFVYFCTIITLSIVSSVNIMDKSFNDLTKIKIKQIKEENELKKVKEKTKNLLLIYNSNNFIIQDNLNQIKNTSNDIRNYREDI